jgi:diguanylate cyclase (GGDEF)-like protein
MNDLLILSGIVLVAVCVWLGWQLRTVQFRLRQLEAEVNERTTDLESARLQIQRACTEDGLTALANHGQFLEFVEREWRRARREGHPISLIFLDLDHFRAFNREYGRRAGDDCLRQVGRVLEGLVGRAGDLVARYHRDEFAIVLAATDDAGAMRVGERVREAIEQLQLPAARDVQTTLVTASVAVACAVPERHSEWEELDLIKVARQAMRDARAAGGNRVHRAELTAAVVVTAAASGTN